MNKETVVNEGKNFCLLREELIDQLFDYLVKEFPLEVWQREGVALSVGCGTGGEVYQLEKRGFRTTACDINSRRLLEGVELGRLSLRNTVWGDYRSCLGRQYDLIIAFHISPGLQLAELVNDCLPSLANGGVMIISGGGEKRREFEEFFRVAELPGVRKLTMVNEANLIDRRILLIEKAGEAQVC